jgi:hypothetical protein
MKLFFVLSFYILIATVVSAQNKMCLRDSILNSYLEKTKHKIAIRDSLIITETFSCLFGGEVYNDQIFYKKDSLPLNGWLYVKKPNFIRFTKYKNGLPHGEELEYDLVKKEYLVGLYRINREGKTIHEYEISTNQKSNFIKKYTVYYPYKLDLDLVKIVYDFDKSKEIYYSYNSEFHFKSKSRFKIDPSEYQKLYVLFHDQFRKEFYFVSSLKDLTNPYFDVSFDGVYSSLDDNNSFPYIFQFLDNEYLKVIDKKYVSDTSRIEMNSEFSENCKIEWDTETYFHIKLSDGKLLYLFISDGEIYIVDEEYNFHSINFYPNKSLESSNKNKTP